MNPFATLVAQVTRPSPKRKQIAFRVVREYRPHGNALALIQELIDAERPLSTAELSTLTGIDIKRIPAALETAIDLEIVRRATQGRGSTFELISESYRTV